MTSITYEHALPIFAEAVYKKKFMNAFQASSLMELVNVTIFFRVNKWYKRGKQKYQ